MLLPRWGEKDPRAFTLLLLWGDRDPRVATPAPLWSERDPRAFTRFRVPRKPHGQPGAPKTP
eukprot:8754944-Pyramimonas_sp.AAC.1